MGNVEPKLYKINLLPYKAHSLNTNNECYFQGIRMSGRTLPRKIFSAGYTKVSFERKMGHMLGHTKGK